jgi:DNA processing protein
MQPAELAPWLRLLRTPGVGPAAIHRLIDTLGSPEALPAAGLPELRRAGFIDALCRAWQAVPEADLASDLAWAAEPGRQILRFHDPAYPAQLREIAAAPPLLFVQGDPDLLALPQLAVVGARSATPQGLENAQAFSAELARRGFVITSGLALGVDGAAHRGALQAQGGTVAVCATGPDRVYPARHQALAREIAVQGALVSEFPIGVPALAENFPRRNRLISGLAMGVLVVEAARESGSLITARLAVEQGREVFAIPGSIHNPMARGCHALIRQGAKLVETADDLLEELGPLLSRHPARRAVVTPAATGTAAGSDGPADPVQAEILLALGDEVLSLDTLADRTGRAVAELQVALTVLELSDRIAVASGGRYQRRRG